MRIALMQPYFLPYLGYFDLISSVDVWVVFDRAQYVRRGWMHRNRILHPTKGWQYIHVPLGKQPQRTAIDEMHLAENDDWLNGVLRRCECYRGHAPYFTSVTALLHSLQDCDRTNLATFNTTMLCKVCEAVGVPCQPVYLSELDCDVARIDGPHDWVFAACRALGATEYLNAPGGRELYAASEFRREGISLQFCDSPPLLYDVSPFRFEPQLSILDLLMWNSTATIRQHLAATRAERQAAAGCTSAAGASQRHENVMKHTVTRIC